jgi:hypothetical protein
LMASHDPRVNEFVDEIKLLKDGQIFSVSSWTDFRSEGLLNFSFYIVSSQILRTLS